MILLLSFAFSYEMATASGLAAAELASAATVSTHFHSPYVLPTSVCQSLRVPSSDPEAYSSPSGEKRTQWTGPK